jgi:hypothetical protein
MGAAYGGRITHLRVRTMLRRGPSHHPASISDRELGIAAILLLFAVVLTTILVPLLG